MENSSHNNGDNGVHNISRDIHAPHDIGVWDNSHDDNIQDAYYYIRDVYIDAYSFWRD
ncbi:MAG: hypothetical protein ACRENZ_02170 [Thermodesulfobacteriota bacterium]